MTKITWLGEDSGDYISPSHHTWNGIRFPKGQAIEVSDPHLIAKAKGNRFYKVEETHVKKVTQGSEEEQGQKEKENVYDFRQGEKGSGYTPVKKKVRKKKAAAAPAVGPTDADA